MATRDPTMKRYTIPLALTGLAAAVVTARVEPAWVREVRRDVRSLWTAEADLREALAEQEEIVADRSELVLQAAVIRRIFEDLAKGRVPLADAADQLEQINRWRPGWIEMLRAQDPTATTDRESHARWAIRWVEKIQGEDPSRQAEVCARLEREYRAMTGRGRPNPASPARSE
jgi:hypothetical protein